MVEIEGESLPNLRCGFLAPTMNVDGIAAGMTMSVGMVESLTVQRTEARPLPVLPTVVQDLQPVEIEVPRRIHKDTRRI